MKKVVNADPLQVGISIRYCNQPIVVAQFLERRPNFGKNDYVVPDCVKHFHRLVYELLTIVCSDTNAAKHSPPQECVVVILLRKLESNPFALFDNRGSRKLLGDTWIVFAQPFIKTSFGTMYHRVNFPERIVEVHRYRTNVVHVMYCIFALRRALRKSRLERRSNRSAAMKYLHTMVRVSDVDASLDFYCDKLGLVQLRRYDNEQGRFSLIFLAAPGDHEAQIELTWNWDPEDYGEGRNFGHVAYEVDDIYALCQRLMDSGVEINRPPRDGRMAFVRSPDNVSIELLQKGEALSEQEPWSSMPNSGHW